MPEAFRLGAKEAAKRIERGELSAEALIASCRERIASREPIHRYHHRNWMADKIDAVARQHCVFRRFETRNFGGTGH